MPYDDGLDEFFDRLLELDAASLCDGAGPARAQVRVPDPAAGIRLISAGGRMIGRAHTVVCDTDFLEVWMGIETAQPGDVLVIEAADRAVIGELFASEAARRGLAGIVVDGYIRDLAFLQEFDLPVYARGATPLAGTIQVATGGAGEAAIGGAMVEDGDIVFGDLDGVLFFDPDALDRLVEAAEAVQAREAAILASVRDGRPIFDHTNLHQHYRLRLDGDESAIEVAAEPLRGRLRP
ncbi:MAG: RraA family protein [Chloroflexota bacterium]